MISIPGICDGLPSVSGYATGQVEGGLHSICFSLANLLSGERSTVRLGEPSFWSPGEPDSVTQTGNPTTKAV